MRKELLLLKEANKTAEEMFLHAKEFSRRQNIPAKSRLDFYKLLMETNARIYTSAKLELVLEEVAQSLRDIACAITLACGDEEELLQLENKHFAMSVANGKR